MKKRWIIIGIVLFIILLIISFLVFNAGDLFKKSSLDLYVENLEQKIDSSQQMITNNNIDIEFKNTEKLYPDLSDIEIRDLEVKLRVLFTEVFPNYSTIKGDYNNYYSQNIEEIQAITGVKTREDFISLINKVSRIPTYDTCLIELEANSLNIKYNDYYANYTVTYDEISEVEYFTIIDLENMKFLIK